MTMKRSMVLALLVGAAFFVGSTAVTPSVMAGCGSCEADDAPKKEEPCPACEENKDGEKCAACEAKKKKDDHGHEHDHDH